MSDPKTTGGTGKSIEQQLDEALADSFPASDPVSFVTSQAEEDWNEGPPDSEQATQPAEDPKRQK